MTRPDRPARFGWFATHPTWVDDPHLGVLRVTDTARPAIHDQLLEESMTDAEIPPEHPELPDHDPQTGVPDTGDLVDSRGVDPDPDEVTDPDDPSYVDPTEVQ